MRLMPIWLSTLALVGVATTSVAQDAVKGRVLAETCMGCHGVSGAKNAYPAYGVPRLGGQHQEYIVSALQAYQRGERNHPTMTAMANALSESEIQDIAAYFAAANEE